MVAGTLGLAGGVALAAVGDGWLGSADLTPNGTVFYDGVGGIGGLTAWKQRALTITLTDTAGGPAYTIRAKGRWAQSYGTTSAPSMFEFSAKNATMTSSLTGGVVCRGGSVVAGGGATPTSGSGASLAAVAETSFPARCPALPGLQYVDIYPASGGGWSAVVYHER